MSQFQYRASIRQTARLFWGGLIDIAQFESALFVYVNTGLTDAYEAGQKEAGLNPDERTFGETLNLQMMIVSEQSRIPSLAELIQLRLKSKGFSFDVIASRIELWANRWLDIKNQALESARNDPKLGWRVDPRNKNCETCLALDGKVKRASTWREAGLHPQQPPNTRLKCGGWSCGCSFTPTTEKMTPGRLPK